MSLILEALKKAQRDRESRQSSEVVAPWDDTPRRSRPMGARAVIAGAVLLFASGGVVTWWWGRAAAPLPAPVSPMETSRSAPAAPPREEGDQPAPPTIRPTSPAKPGDPGPSGTGNVAGRPVTTAPVKQPLVAPPSAALVPPPRESATPAPVQNPAAPPAPPPPARPSVPPQAKSASVVPPVTPRTEPVPAPLPAAPLLTPRVEPKPVLPVSPSLTEAISNLTLNAHIYSEVKEDRVVYIDGRRYIEGQRVNGLYLLEEITPQGVLLSYQGERDLLPMKAAPFRRP
jgi:hypothetical protein